MTSPAEADVCQRPPEVADTTITTAAATATSSAAAAMNRFLRRIVLPHLRPQDSSAMPLGLQVLELLQVLLAVDLAGRVTALQDLLR